MNSDKQSRGCSTAGNALLYILLALALLGLLTMALRSQSDQAGSENLEKEQAQLYATKMVAYAASIKNVVDQMLMTGTLRWMDREQLSQVSWAGPHRKIAARLIDEGLGEYLL